MNRQHLRKLPMLDALSSQPQFAIVDIPKAALHPAWTWGTILYHDDAGEVVGYGRFERLGKEAAEVQVSFAPSGVALLSPSPQPGDA